VFDSRNQSFHTSLHASLPSRRNSKGLQSRIISDSYVRAEPGA
jgi:hypothetical protein